jgi:hypothetical protein
MRERMKEGVMMMFAIKMSVERERRELRERGRERKDKDKEKERQHPEPPSIYLPVDRSLAAPPFLHRIERRRQRWS